MCLARLTTILALTATSGLALPAEVDPDVGPLSSNNTFTKRSAAYATLYYDNACTQEYYQDEINGDSCSSPSEGFSSMIINSCTSGDDYVKVYSGNACAGTVGTIYECDNWINRCAGFGTCNSAYYFSQNMRYAAPIA